MWHLPHRALLKPGSEMLGRVQICDTCYIVHCLHWLRNVRNGLLYVALTTLCIVYRWFRNVRGGSNMWRLQLWALFVPSQECLQKFKYVTFAVSCIVFKLAQECSEGFKYVTLAMLYIVYNWLRNVRNDWHLQHVALFIPSPSSGMFS